jgi:hypothetical protein
MSLKLPKQWKHWCRTAGLRPEYRPNSKGAYWSSLNGAGRKWRIALRSADGSQSDCIFQVGDTYDDFDRWALSRRISFEIPKTWAEFKAIIDQVRAINQALAAGNVHAWRKSSEA